MICFAEASVSEFQDLGNATLLQFHGLAGLGSRHSLQVGLMDQNGFEYKSFQIISPSPCSLSAAIFTTLNEDSVSL